MKNRYDTGDYNRATDFLRKLSDLLDEHLMIEASDVLDIAIDACIEMAKLSMSSDDACIEMAKPSMSSDIENYIKERFRR